MELEDYIYFTFPFWGRLYRPIFRGQQTPLASLNFPGPYYNLAGMLDANSLWSSLTRFVFFWKGKKNTGKTLRGW